MGYDGAVFNLVCVGWWCLLPLLLENRRGGVLGGVLCGAVVELERAKLCHLLLVTI